MPTPSLPDATFWKRKLAAFLHDPPEKAFDYGPHHVERARIYAQNLGVDLAEWLRGSDKADWSAAAADRFLFPTVRLGGEPSFQHPLSPSPDGPLLTRSDFPDQATTEQIVSHVLPAFKADEKTTFLRVWRKWLQSVVEYGAEKKGAEWIGLLPADTRIPDASIWHHTAITSALEATRGTDGQLHPAFLLVQVGPVQDFIAQARSTRDLWSGSFLLSWLMLHGMLAVADTIGPDSIIFPSLRGQPLYDWLKRGVLGLDEKRLRDQDAALVPNFPNRFLAVVPADFDATAVGAALHSEWRKIANTCRDWLAKCGLPLSPELNALWDEQVGTESQPAFWQIHWALHPWDTAKEALTALDSIPADCAPTLKAELEVARSIPADDVDSRCLRNGEPNRGWAWNAHYERCAHLLVARRNLRDFAARPTRTHSLAKDQFDGSLEAICGSHPGQIHPWESAQLRHLFRREDALAAPNLIKRVWHTAYLAEKHSLHRARAAFDSVPAIAATPWLRRLERRIRDDQTCWLKFLEVAEAISAARDALDDVAVADSPARSAGPTESDWIRRTDAAAFIGHTWTTRLRPTEQLTGGLLAKATRAAAALAAFKRDFALGEPAAYYAVLALDGDEMGKWISGKKAPHLRELLTPDAVAYYEKRADGRTWLNLPRRLSPSYHLQFSEALANFALFAACRVVEDAHHGQLIYAGGDDVLAMVPAAEALACARGLRLAFQGDTSLAETYPNLFTATKPGFIRLANPRGHEPSWPLLVPGSRATVSVGVAIAHIKEPLQDVVYEAQQAEKRAKQRPLRRELDREKKVFVENPAEGLSRDAVAVSLFKRSGETIHWGAKFESAAWRVLAHLHRDFRSNPETPDRAAPIGKRFPYRLAQLLAPYGHEAHLDPTLCDIAVKELAHVVSRQCAPSKDWPERDSFVADCAAYLAELRDFAFKDIDYKAKPAPRKLADFAALFLTEAFISRHED